MAHALPYDAARQTGIESATISKLNTPIRRKSPPRHGMKSTSIEPAKLQKPLPTPSKHARASSGQFLNPRAAQPQSLRTSSSLQNLDQQYGAKGQLNVPGALPPFASAAVHSRESSLDLPPFAAAAVHSREGSVNRPLPMAPGPATGSRPTTPNHSQAAMMPITPPSSNASTTGDKKKHGLLRKKKDKHEEHTPLAWIAGHPEKRAYDVEGLLLGRPVVELWDAAQGNCLVHLFPLECGKGPAFQVDSAILESSAVLRQQVFTQQDQYIQLMHLDLQLKLSPGAISHGTAGSTTEPTQEDLQIVVDYRNLFAFLCGQSLIATETRSSIFSIFIAVASLLKAYDFSNVDGSTLGGVANASFASYVNELSLADVRSSREKTIEGIILGERMRSAALYTESFTHAVGKLSDLIGLNSKKFDMITATTRNRLTRASLDLEKREEAVNFTLKDFDFPSIFSGIMSSKTAEERKEGVRFDAWKEAFLNTRKWLLATLKQQYGDWPPKAKSKKNDLETSGLQRLVLQRLYLDLCSMYDLLVDRKQLTTRTVDGIDRAGPVEAPQIRALRSVLSEYDRSSPPVKSPVPFDLPRVPTLATTRKDFGKDANTDAKLATRKLKDDEVAHMLRASWNDDAIITPFVNAFRDMERRAAHGCTLQEIVDLRMGQWIFMYAVLQALPMLACDAPGVNYTDNVEYFLCEAPRDAMPWTDPANAAQKKWFAVGEAGSVVSLPAHIVEHGVEGIYRRSHCWRRAEEWAAANPILNRTLHEQVQAASAQANLPEPQMRIHGHSDDPVRNSERNSSLNLGLEALTLPPTIPRPTTPSSAATPVVHKVNSAKTFDAIFATMDNKKTKKKK